MRGLRVARWHDFSPARVLLACKWGGHCLISLYLSLISGLVVALQYNPADPFYAAATLELVIPFGSFWRGLHYYASQAFFLLLLCHLGAILRTNTQSLAPRAWLRLTLTIPITLLLLFTGYILRGDATGAAAGTIAEHITLAVPLLGEALNSLTLAVAQAGVTKVYANHLIGLMALGLVCGWPHLRRYSARWSDHLPVVVLTVALAIFVVVPLEPDQLGISHIRGPWFFVGLQELLRYLPPLWAGVILPALPTAALLVLPAHQRTTRWLLLFIILWLSCYAVLSILGFRRI